MADPIVQVYQPRLRGTEWAAAAEIRTPAGKVRLMATAPQAVVARYLALLHTLVAIKRGAAVPIMVGDDEVAGFFDSVWKGIKSVVKHPVFKKVVGTVVDCIPVVGPALQKTGITKMGLNALQKAAAGGKGSKKSRAALRGITQMAAQGIPKAVGVNATLAAGARVMKKHGKAGFQAFGGLGGALQQLKNAKLGGKRGKAAKARIAKVVKAAQAGNTAAIQAAAYLAGARSVMRAPTPRRALEDYEHDDELDELELELEELEDEGSDFIEDLESAEAEERRQRFGEDVSIHDVSGDAWDAEADATIGALDRAARAGTLLALLRRLRQRRRGVRVPPLRPRKR